MDTKYGSDSDKYYSEQLLFKEMKKNVRRSRPKQHGDNSDNNRDALGSRHGAVRSGSHDSSSTCAKERSGTVVV
jgi:hypothetical protein